jgi:hypothetical protein
MIARPFPSHATWSHAMRNIVVIKYKRSASINQGAFNKTEASFYCQNGEHEAKTLKTWLADNLITAEIFDQTEWDKLPDEYPLG